PDQFAAGAALTAFGHQVRVLADWFPCDELLAGTPPELILVRVFLPSTTGLPVICRVRCHFPGVPIVAVCDRELSTDGIALLERYGVSRFFIQHGFPSTLPAFVAGVLRLRANERRPLAAAFSGA